MSILVESIDALTRVDDVIRGHGARLQEDVLALRGAEMSTSIQNATIDRPSSSRAYSMLGLDARIESVRLSGQPRRRTSGTQNAAHARAAMLRAVAGHGLLCRASPWAQATAAPP